MNTLVDSDIQRFVACLVLGYLENQQLQKSYSSFCETSRHLTKEKNGLKYGNKPLDTSLGLVNIVREYFLLKSRINEFLRQCPQYPLVIKLIDTEDTFLRLDIILKALKDLLDLTEKEPSGKSKKRKHDEEFDISQTNTSTPESLNPPKRKRKSLTTPFLTLSANKEVQCRNFDKSSASRAELNYESSSDTSEKEDDGIEEEGEHSPIQRSTASPTAQALKEKKFIDQVINDKVVAGNLADLINKTLTAQELEPKPSKSHESQDIESGGFNDLENILSGTQNDPSFDEIINDAINKYFSEYPENVGQTSTSSEKQTTESETAAVEEIPIKQRLRPRIERKQAVSERKRVNIISNEPYTGIVPAVANLSTLTTITHSDITQLPQFLFIQSGNEVIPVLQAIPAITTSTSAGVISTTSKAVATTSTMIYQNVEKKEAPSTTADDNQVVNEAEKKESTPKITLYPSFLESKSKSTPRRKAQHVRILDFNQTPSNRRLSTVKEFSTPSNGIPTTTPGSAPATIDFSKSKREEEKPQITANDDESSNSISHTPKVSKRCRSRKIAIQKSEEKTVPGEEELKKPVSTNLNIQTVDDWKNMRNQSKAIPIDQLLRLQNQEAETNSPKKRLQKKRRQVKAKIVAKKLTPIKSKTNKAKEKGKSSSIEIDENKPLSAMKFRISSPRKLASNKKSPKKKTHVTNSSQEIKLHESQQDTKATKGETTKETAESSQLDRSDTVQEVAMVLTNFPETILARHKSIEEMENKSLDVTPVSQLETPFKEVIASLNETPFKTSLMTPLPNTPRFAIPLLTTTQETPMPKIFADTNTTITLQSLVKNCDIPTPSFAITPGFKLTPLKDLQDFSPTSGYSRRTDYSSSSSYYKPDESEEINQKINAIINQRRDGHHSQSESEPGTTSAVGSVKKVECPGAIERVKSFTEHQTEHPMPHYKMMDEDGLLSESFVTTATEGSSSGSSFTCSTCSTDNTDEDTMEKIERFAKTDEKDSEWDCEDHNVKTDNNSPSLMNEKTGEVRFPLRNWITPKKIEISPEQVRTEETNKIKSLLQSNNSKHGLSIEEEKARIIREQEAVKKRTLAKIRSESAAFSSKPLQKFKKSQVKKFKLPSNAVANPAYVNRRDQILQQQFSERPRPTTNWTNTKLISSNSSSRRKNATPRKTIPMNELPREQSSQKKTKAKPKPKDSAKQTEQNNLSIENVSDNAVMPEDSTSLEISSSFNTSNEEETASTVITNQTSPKLAEEGSNTFQRTLIAQGFDKIEAKGLQVELVDKLEIPTVSADGTTANNISTELVEQKLEDEPITDKSETEVLLKSSENIPKEIKETIEADESEEESDDSDDEDLADENEKRVFNFEEPEKFKAISNTSKLPILSIKCRIEDRVVNLADTNNINLFYMDSEIPCKLVKAKKISANKPSDEKSNGKSSPTRNGKSKVQRKPSLACDQTKSVSSKSPNKSKPKGSPDQSQTVPDISAILATIHGK